MHNILKNILGSVNVICGINCSCFDIVEDIDIEFSIY